MPNFQALTSWILILLTLTLKIKIGYPYNETELRPDPRKKSLRCNAILVVRSRFVDKPKRSKQEGGQPTYGRLDVDSVLWHW